MPKALRFLFLSMSLALIAGLVAMSLAEYAKTGRCYRNGSMLSAEELRARTIRSLLSAWMETSARLNEDKSRYQTFLMRNSLTPNEVIDSITSKSIANFPQEAVYPLKTDRDVESVDSNFLRGGFSIVRYSATGYAEIVPSKSLQAVDANSARKFFDDMAMRGIGLSLIERALGHGNHLFHIDYYGFIDLGCCDKRFSDHPKGGRSADWYARSNIHPILKGEQPSHLNLVVSNCGEVLQRSEDESTRFFF